ncbi:MAG: YcaO-like family protein [Candidatus Omnitrophota bacterium]|jgi:ribosomal protein S12 methylthiotransferase accessory factor
MKLSNIVRGRGELAGKSLPAGETVRRALSALRKLSPPLGVALKRIDACDVLRLPVYKCEITVKAKDGFAEGEFFKRISYGKGRNAELSKASALMEFVERFSCQAFLDNKSNYRAGFQGGEDHKRAVRIIPFSWQERYRKDRFICGELKKRPLKLYHSFSLTENKPFLFPLDWFTSTTNGFASGNCLEEAVLQGLCEVIERHNIADIVGNRIITPLVDVVSVKNNAARDIISRFVKSGLRLFIRDFSHKIGVPTVGVLVYDRASRGAARFNAAAGASVSRDIALLRALSELAQNRSQGLSRQTCLYRSCGFSFYCSFLEAEYLCKKTKPVPFSSLPDHADGNFRSEIMTAVKKLEYHGLPVIVTEVTHPVLRIPSVIVTVPGALHRHCGFTDPYFKLQKDCLLSRQEPKAGLILRKFLRVYGLQGIKREYLLNLAGQYEKTGHSRLAEDIYEAALGAFADDKDTVFNLKCYRGLARAHLNGEQ